MKKSITNKYHPAHARYQDLLKKVEIAKEQQKIFDNRSKIYKTLYRLLLIVKLFAIRNYLQCKLFLRKNKIENQNI